MERLCPHCHKPINDDDALLCLFCGESLKDPSTTKRSILIIVVILIIIAFLLLQIL
ncbi:MAG: hypothetical protein AAB213_03675 [Candidatus Omnitrophota bacterium]